MSCGLKEYSSTPCGANPRAAIEGSRIISLASCNKNITVHCQSLKISGIEDEIDLILLRAGLFARHDASNLTVCPIHRHQFGIGWRRSTRKCAVPSSIAGHRKPGEIATGIGRTISQYIWDVTGILLAAGSGMCSTCKKKLTNESKDTISEEAVSMLAESFCGMDLDDQEEGEAKQDQEDRRSASCVGTSFMSETLVDSSTETSNGESQVVTESEQSGEDSQSLKVTRKRLLNNFLQVSEKEQVSTMRNSWESSTERTQREHIRKAKSAISGVLEVIARAPDDVDKLWRAVCKSSLESRGDMSPKDRELMEALAECYLNATHWSTRRQILSVIADKVFYKELLQFLPGVTAYRFNIARHHSLLHGRGSTVPKISYARMKVDQSQLDHFLDFITSAHLIQDLPFGEKLLKLSTGEVLTVPNVIRTMIPKRIIMQYFSFCEESSFEAPHEATLYRILNVCLASTRTSMQGLDNFTAEGGKAYEELDGIVDKLVEHGMTYNWGRMQKDRLRSSKRHMKGEYKVHVSESSTVPDHCRMMALSDPSDEAFAEPCTHNHNDRCKDCDILEDVIEEMKSELQSQLETTKDEKDEMLFFIDTAYQDILLWKAHQLRCVNQDERQRELVDTHLDENVVLVTQDWAMKYLPRKFRESQADWFGKRGISWHISVALRRCGEELETLTFVHIFQSVAQDSNCVIAIMHDVIKRLQQEVPELRKVYFRQDNAGCYHSANTLLAVKDITQRTRVAISAIDFSDPQGGKGSCDRKAASLKRKIGIYCNEGHDVEDGNQMKDGLESGLASANVNVVLSSVTPSKAEVKWEGISFLNNFEFSEAGVRAWRAYHIGPGRLYKWKNFGELPTAKQLECIDQSKQQGCFKSMISTTTSCKEVESSPASLADEQPQGATSEAMTSTTTDQRLFFCTEDACQKSFQRFSALEKHLMVGRHVYSGQQLTMADKAKMGYAERLEGGYKSTHQLPFDKAQGESQPKQLPIGWGLKKPSRHARFTDKQKVYLVQKFNIGEQCGRKVEAVDVKMDMRKARDDHGNKLFQPSQYLTEQQISGFFQERPQEEGRRLI